MQEPYLAEYAGKVCRMASNRFTKLPTKGTLQEKFSRFKKRYHKEVTKIAALKGIESTFSGSTHIKFKEVYIANRLLHFIF